MTIWETIATERRRLADELENLTDEQWAAQSQCEAWTVEEAAAHLIVPFEISTPKFLLNVVASRGNINKALIKMTAKVHSSNSRTDVIRKIRENAESQWTPPRLGPEIPLSEIVVHGQDIRRPLGLANTIPEETIALTLDGISNDEVRADYAERIGV